MSVEEDDLPASTNFELFLEENDLKASQFDLSSLEALKEIILQSSSKATPTTTSTSITQHQHTNTNDKDVMEREAYNHRVHFSQRALSPPDFETLTPFERYVVQKLEQQDQLITDLHRRLLETPSSSSSTSSYQPLQQQQQQQQQQQPLLRDIPGEAFHREVIARRLAVPPQPHPRDVARQPLLQPNQQQPPLIPAPANTNVWIQLRDTIVSYTKQVQTSRIGRLLYLVYSVGRLQLNNRLDLFLILKVLFMLAILTNNLNSTKRYTNKDKDNSSTVGMGWSIKFYLMGSMILLGFLAQTGIFSFLYKFCIQHKFPHRILVDNEVITTEQANGEMNTIVRPLQNNNNDNNNNNNNNNAGGWRETFLFGGQIAGPMQPPPNELQVQAIPWWNKWWTMIEDILFLLGSFVLSIFPMWRAAPRPNHRMVQNENDNNQNHENEHNDNLQQGPGIVAAPVDPAGPEDDENDDDEEEIVVQNL